MNVEGHGDAPRAAARRDARERARARSDGRPRPRVDAPRAAAPAALASRERARGAALRQLPPGGVTVGGAAAPPIPRPPFGLKFIASIDTMKLSKDRAGEGFTSADAQAVDLAATTGPTHITVDTPMEYPTVMGQW